MDSLHHYLRGIFIPKQALASVLNFPSGKTDNIIVSYDCFWSNVLLSNLEVPQMQWCSGNKINRKISLLWLVKQDIVLACGFPHANIIDCVMRMVMGILECYFTGSISEIGILSIYNVAFSFEIRFSGIVFSIKINTYHAGHRSHRA